MITEPETPDCCDDVWESDLITANDDSCTWEIIRLQPDGSTRKTTVTHCPFCGHRLNLFAS